jgi:hypothetical protein
MPLARLDEGGQSNASRASARSRPESLGTVNQIFGLQPRTMAIRQPHDA